MMKTIFPLAAMAAALLAGPNALGAEPPDAAIVERDQAFFAFGGILTDENMGRSANPVRVTYENKATAGIGYQTFLHRRGGLALGLELGVAARAGSGTTAELWGGPVARYDGLSLFNRINVSPAFTVGLSAVSGTHPGREQRLEDRYEGDASLLFYLGPEVNFSLPERPEVEAFYRLHHRSGADGTLGNMRGAMNANVVGMRFQF